MPPVLELRGITKTFPGVRANDHIDLTLNEGEILALLGENGAGKTTLMNILYGLYTPDEGEILVRGARVDIHNPRDAIQHGIGMVHQHFMLVPVFTVTENVMLGIEKTQAGVFLDRKTVAKEIEEISTRFGLKVDPDAMVEDLPVGLQQRVEIIKVLYRQADILILDEPTAVLTPQEVEDLFKVIRSLVSEGKSVIFISHKLNEVLEIADHITVLRLGRVVGTLDPDEATPESCANMMVGRTVMLTVEKGPATVGDEVLGVSDLSVLDDRKLEAVKGVAFQVHAGEVLGIAGVQGNGQTELVEALTGLRPIKRGHISFLGQAITESSPRKIHELGSAHVPEDRQRDGLVLAFSVADNLVLNTYYEAPFTKGLNLRQNEIEKAAAERVELFDIRTPNISVPVSNLSGGNQQKVIVAREFSRPIKLLIASQPTRGLDVGSIEYIHSRIIQKRDEGCAILVVSTELDEILSLADRIAVMFAGKIISILNAEEATRERLGLLMAGVQEVTPAEMPA
ncbi:MAG: putative transporter ATP-binding protein [Chloroflexi bacterium]|nr:putative transporter ATP-binding protein [Chloroflexota bacterium]